MAFEALVARDLPGAVLSTAPTTVPLSGPPAATLNPWLIGAYIGLYAYSSWKRNRELKKALRDAARSVINLRGEYAGRPVPAAYGYVYIDVFPSYVAVGSSLDADSGTKFGGSIGGMGGYTGQGPFNGARGGSDTALLMQQCVIAAHQINQVLDLWVDGIKVDANNPVRRYVLAILGEPGVAHPTSDNFQQHGLYPPNRNLFIGLSYLNVWHLNPPLIGNIVPMGAYPK